MLDSHNPTMRLMLWLLHVISKSTQDIILTSPNTNSEKILGKKVMRQDDRYLVKWKNFRSWQNTLIQWSWDPTKESCINFSVSWSFSFTDLASFSGGIGMPTCLQWRSETSMNQQVKWSSVGWAKVTEWEVELWNLWTAWNFHPSISQ